MAGLSVIMGLLLWSRGEAENTGILNIVTPSSYVVVIDAGHGGFDPGKVGVDGTLEKDINLSIACFLQELLEEENIKVIMTRTEDKAVGESGGKVSKQEDMKTRVSIINESEACLAVSIHQNSFTEESSRGAQIFYHPQSEEGEILAMLIQENIKEVLGDDNHRQAKSNDSYYMLKKTSCPIVIAECGFLSNYAETALLKEEAYQKKVAEGIKEGILAYLKLQEEKKSSLSVWTGSILLAYSTGFNIASAGTGQ